MRLRTKLVALSVALIIVTIITFSTLILVFMRNSQMKDVVTKGIADYNQFSSAFAKKSTDDISNLPTVQRSFFINQFRAVSGFSEFTLRVGDEFLYNNAGFDPKTLFENGDRFTESEDDDVWYRTVRVFGTEYFIVQSADTNNTEGYSITLVRNISAVTDSVRRMAMLCGTLGACVILGAGTAMWAIVVHSLKPIKALKASASQLAQGQYDKRIAVSGEDELSELATDFNQMAEAVQSNILELNDKTERQQTFINDLSHELKTPITSIMLCAETLLRREVSSDVQSTCLNRIYEQAKWLERLSQKLMTLVLLQGKITRQPVSATELLDAVASTTVDALHEKNIELKVTCEIDVMDVDFDLMRSAIVNLVENARKASREGQIIEVNVTEHMIEVIDHGMGIPEEEMERITDPFYMVDRSRSRTAGGSGLGLAIVKAIIQAHGATLSIHSQLGEGTVMSINFE